MFFDIGANVGKWARVNSSTASKIICVEADPATYAKLSGQCANNPNIVCENYAVCDSSSSEITFYKCTSADTISTLNRDWLADPSSRFNKYPFVEIKCKTITIDALIDKYGVPDLIKVDVEGGEYQCIRSLTRKVDSLCFEWASETNAITFNCLEYLQSLGFTKFFLQFEDSYSFRPTTYTSVEDVIEQLRKTTPKKEWGMMWCM